MAKTIDTSTLFIENIIVHSIPKHKKDDYSIEGRYSDQESVLSDGLKRFFKDKVNEALKSTKALRVCYDKNNESTAPISINNIISEEATSFVERSKELGKRLYNIQVGNNAAGILIILRAKLSDHYACIVLKLEMDNGAQLILDPVTNSFNIEEVKDLMLTQKTKVYKVALFLDREYFKVKYDGIVMDYQIDIKLKNEITTFFMSKFLGCIPFEDPKITTKKFYTLTRTFIDSYEDEHKKAKYIQDLNSYIQKNNNLLSPEEFATDYLETIEERNNYKNYLTSKNFKFTSFTKDINLIENKIKKITLEFENGISIIGNKGTFDKKVKLIELDGGNTRAEIVSKIKKVD